MFSVRGKLYALNGSAWKERGVGVLKVNVNELTRRARIRKVLYWLPVNIC